MKSALGKVASYIHKCGQKNFYKHNDSYVNIPFQRGDLAEYLGMQPETLSRCFQQLKDQKIIEYDKVSSIQIKNPTVLREIAEGNAIEKYINLSGGGVNSP